MSDFQIEDAGAGISMARIQTRPRLPEIFQSASLHRKCFSVPLCLGGGWTISAEAPSASHPARTRYAHSRPCLLPRPTRSAGQRSPTRSHWALSTCSIGHCSPRSRQSARTPDGIAIPVERYEARPDHVLHPRPEPVRGRWKVPRVLAPERAQSSFHRVAGRQPGQPYAVALRESLPVRSIFLGLVEHRSPARTEQSHGQQLRDPAVVSANHFTRSVTTRSVTVGG